MKANVKEHLDQLDVSLGGGIISEKTRVDAIDNPMLVIGVGGTGIDALLRLKYQVNKRFKLPEDKVTKRKKDKPNNIEFIGFETNESEKLKKYNGIGLDPYNELVLLSNANIGGLLRNPTLMPPCIKEWISPELGVLDGTNGAGGVRQSGRLLLFTRLDEVVNSIERKIKLLMEGKDKKLIVFLVSGISGGTGSGCFIDIAYIVRGIMDKLYPGRSEAKHDILGYVFTPDVNLSVKALSDHTRDYVIKNGYAALKELDYFMNINERNEKFKQNYWDKLYVDSPLPPFNFCTLISGTNKNGKILENAYDYCMNVTAENITNFMANEERESGQEFAIHDYMSNIDANVKQMFKPRMANYKYNVIGASSAVLPIEQITTFLAYKLFGKMEKMFSLAPGDKDIEAFIRQIKLDKDAISEKFETNIREPLPGYQNSERLSFDNVIKFGHINVDSELKEGFLLKASEEYIKMRKQYPGELMLEFRDQMDRMFTDPSKGPFYVSRLIYSDDGFCLIKTLQAYIAILNEKLRNIPDDIKRCSVISQNKMAEAKKVLLFNKETKKNDYIVAKIDEFNLRADEEKIKRMIEFYQDIIVLINDLNNKIYNVFTEILNRLNSIFEKDGNILVNGKEEDINGNKKYYWNVVNVPDVVKTIEKLMDDNNTDELMRNFTTEMIQKSNLWVKDEDLDVVGNISDFLTDKFSDIITKSMEDFLYIKYGNDKSIDKIIYEDIAQKLNNEAVPVFCLDNNDGLRFPRWGMISIPVKTPNIKKGIEEFEKNATSSNGFTVKESQLTSRIFWLNTENGVPLYAYAPLKQYEEVYEKTIFQNEGIGRHLIQSKENNWAYLPSPIPEEVWGETHNNARIKKYNDYVRDMFNKALELNCIVKKAENQVTTNNYELICTDDFDVNAFINNYNMQLDSSNPNFTEIKKCITELNKIKENGICETNRKSLLNSMNEESARNNLTRCPYVVESLKKELDKYNAINEKIAELRNVIKSFERQESQMDDFIEVLYTDTIRKKGAVYVYDKNNEEKEEWEPFVNLMKSKEFIEYEIYKKFKALDDKHINILKGKSEKRATDMVTTEDISPLIDRLEMLINSYKDNLDILEYRRYELTEGEEILEFYKVVLEKLKDMKLRIQ